MPLAVRSSHRGSSAVHECGVARGAAGRRVGTIISLRGSSPPVVLPVLCSSPRIAPLCTSLSLPALCPQCTSSAEGRSSAADPPRRTPLCAAATHHRTRPDIQHRMHAWHSTSGHSAVTPVTQHQRTRRATDGALTQRSASRGWDGQKRREREERASKRMHSHHTRAFDAVCSPPAAAPSVPSPSAMAAESASSSAAADAAVAQHQEVFQPFPDAVKRTTTHTRTG